MKGAIFERSLYITASLKRVGQRPQLGIHPTPTTTSFLENRLLQNLPLLGHNLLTRNHNNQNTTNLLTPINPLMVCPPLHHKLSRPHSLLFATIQSQNNLPGHNGRVIAAQGPMHRRSTTRWDVGGAEHDAGGWAAREGLGEVGGHAGIGDGDGEAGVEA